VFEKGGAFTPMGIENDSHSLALAVSDGLL
jgi:hypothetical protein